MSKWYRWTVIAAVLAVVVVAVRTCQVSQSPLSGLDDLNANDVLEAGLTLQDVTLEQPDENGNLLWKVKAQEVSYSPDQKVAEIRVIDGEFYEDGEIIYRVTADRGEVLEDGKTFFLEDNIVAIAIESDLTLKGDQLEWRSEEDLLIVQDSIDGIHPQINATAQEARLFNQEKRLELDAGVTATTTEAPWMGLQSETLVWYLDEKRLETEVPLTIEQFKDEDDDTVTDRIVGNQGEFKLDDNILDVEIAVDMMALVGCYDTAVLVSGDGDLAYAVDAASYRGVRIEVVSLRSMTSDSLINVSDRYIDLDSIKDDIKKSSRSSSQNGYTYRPLSGISVLDGVDDHS